MRVHFLLGPAGSGKTWRCLEEIRAELKQSPAGPPLLLLAPKQATFQLERQLLEGSGLAGYSRLQIVSFDRLARWLLETFSTVPELLDDEGRVMVLRALLAREHAALRVFRATARLPGFARQLSQLLREFQRHQLTPARLARLAGRVAEVAPLRDKLHDLHHLLGAYHDWLGESQLQDGDQLLDLATTFLRDPENGMVVAVSRAAGGEPPLQPPPRSAPHAIAGLWLDGFAEMTPQELDLLCALLPFCRQATLAFCLDPHAGDERSWLSLWSTVRRTFGDCHNRVAALFQPGELTVEELSRAAAHSRFAACPALARLEANWSAPPARAGDLQTPSPAPSPAHASAVPGFPVGDGKSAALRIALCPNPEAEATLAAREVLRHVHAGGRFRDCAIILRTLDHHHAALRRAFTLRGIPFFLDRREPVAHHPLAELTRFALRTLAFGWQPEDLLGALKSGLVHERDADVDWLENLALAHGWRGAQWLEPLRVAEAKFDMRRAEQLRARFTAPFRKLDAQLGGPDAETRTSISGSALAAALRAFWDDLGVEMRLAAWDDALAGEGDAPAPADLAPPLHATVLRQMHEWLENLERAFPAAAGASGSDSSSSAPAALPLREWLPILEAGLSALSVGVIPPALDQVLIGTVDRSRNPELRLALVLGLNEGVFPAPPAAPVLLTEAERELLSLQDIRLGADTRAQIAHERYLAYIACTRSRTRLVLSSAAADSAGRPLHPSPLLAQVCEIFPELELEKVPPNPGWREAGHAEDLLAPLLRQLAVTPAGDLQSPPILQLAAAPALAPIVARWRSLAAAQAVTQLSPAAVAQLYGAELPTSVSKLEQFAECPFKFFVAAGLGAEERKEFEVDHRERGTFIHRLLDEFHTRVTATGRRWRDLPPAEAAELAARIGEDLLASPDFALFAADESRRFAARTLIGSAQRLLAALVGWMPGYAFDPVAVELGFGLGPNPALPAWRLPLGVSNALLLRGRIDRVDLCRDEKSGESFAVIVDYKSSPKKLEPRKIAAGLQLQLLAYLNVLHGCRPEGTPANAGGGMQDVELRPHLLTSAASAPQPAGVFYIPLHGAAGGTGERAAILSEDEAARRAAYQHAGRFDLAQLARLDARPGGQPSGQFRYSLNKDGSLSKRGGDALPSAGFAALLKQVEAIVCRLGITIFAGEVSVAPVRLSATDTACARCDYRPICRFDPWTQPYRLLPEPAAKEEET